ncbi:MAG: sigma 54-interacting transcriptional regulator [Desulfatirhabdiaceae bacterium]
MNLNFIQDREYERIGDSILRKADVRIIAATNADLEKRVRERRFREDLFYRLNVIAVTIPPASGATGRYSGACNGFSFPFLPNQSSDGFGFHPGS